MSCSFKADVPDLFCVSAFMNNKPSVKTAECTYHKRTHLPFTNGKQMARAMAAASRRLAVWKRKHLMAGHPSWVCGLWQEEKSGLSQTPSHSWLTQTNTVMYSGSRFTSAPLSLVRHADTRSVRRETLTRGAYAERDADTRSVRRERRRHKECTQRDADTRSVRRERRRYKECTQRETRHKECTQNDVDTRSVRRMTLTQGVYAERDGNTRSVRRERHRHEECT
ncbi:hypothetical protein WMY93_004495 [Mugilogobius chulae]|uniref:Uncharacterized protein n=1 Tax=Mugilogobius chulae TaxID=88201 RepID=A0AAW0PRA3_9GOBI